MFVIYLIIAMQRHHIKNMLFNVFEKNEWNEEGGRRH
jgi:hypothetical protein